jgi:hypothetical protein
MCNLLYAFLTLGVRSVSNSLQPPFDTDEQLLEEIDMFG